MGTRQPYQPHKLIIAVLVSEDYAGSVSGLVGSLFGEIGQQSAEMPFSFTTYYDGEMRTGLRRRLFSICGLVDPSRLPDFKRMSNRAEQASARPDGSRRVNLDPGLLSLSRVILATTKASAHRIAIGDGLYAEITLMFRKGRYAPLEWTYPDFASRAYVDWLGDVRESYHTELKNLDPERNWRL